MPDNTALSYKENQGNFENARDANNTNLWGQNNRNLIVSSINNLTAFDLKSIFKQYQMCFVQSIYNPYEYVEGDTTVVVNPSQVVIDNRT